MTKAFKVMCFEAAFALACQMRSSGISFNVKGFSLGSFAFGSLLLSP